VHKFVSIPDSVHFYFAKIIHSPDRCGISKSWQHDSMIRTHVHLVLGTIKWHSKTQFHRCLKFWGSVQWACGMNNLSTISRLKRHFREFSSTSNRHHNPSPRVTTRAR
jgi:hypothetical protein